MNLALATALVLALTPAQAPSTPSTPDNLDFGSGTLAGWEGEGFYVTTGLGQGPSLHCGVCSSDRGKKGQTGMLHRTIVVPPNAGALRFTAQAIRPKGQDSDGILDVYLLASGKRALTKKVRTAKGYEPAAAIRTGDKGRPREYVFPLTDYAGQTLRLALMDEDKRPGCSLACSGFTFMTFEEYEGREFGRFMLRLVKDHKLPEVGRYESKHFTAFSNAEESYTERRMNNCELIYDLFFDHFRRRGFRIREPNTKLMVAIFDSQAGFEAYLGDFMPTAVTGVYHPPSNRLVVYDFGQNRAFVAHKQMGVQEAKKIHSDWDRRRYIETVNRRAQEFRSDANIGTVMHEVAHQLSFNSGMLNREGDVALWLAEGLACYCEATDGSGAWQGLGELNHERITTLAGPFRGQGQLIRLQDLVTSDHWIRVNNGQFALVGYAQSWALFRMLMEERPRELRKYLNLIYARRTADNRLDDFGQAFGSDMNRLQLRYVEYMKELVERHHRPRH